MKVSAESVNQQAQPSKDSSNQNNNETETAELYKESLNRLPIQCKLFIGAADDPLEKEADDMAATVMRMPEQTFIQRKCSHCEEEQKINRKPLTSFIQRKTSTNGAVASDAIANRIESSKGTGSPLPAQTRSFMESRFGTDFGQVNIHTGSESVQMNRDLQAKAFTVGNDIYFNQSQYQPGSKGGDQLIAHELTHVVQQGGGHTVVQRFSCDQILNSEEGERVNGIRAHQVITQDFKSQVGNRAKGFRIPGASSLPIRLACGDTPEDYVPPMEFVDRPSGRENVGIPDLAYVDDNRYVHLGEIKIGVHSCRQMAEEQVGRYVEQGNMDDPEMTRYKSSPYMVGKLREMGLTGPIAGFRLMSPDTVPYTVPNSVNVDGKTVHNAYCGNGVIVYKNVGEASEDRHLCDQSPDSFVDNLIGRAEGLVDEYIDRHVDRLISQTIDTLNFEEMITLAYQHARPAIQQAVVNNFGQMAWDIITAMNDQQAVQHLAQLLESQLGNAARQQIRPIIMQVKNVLLQRIKQYMRRMLRPYIQRIMAALCESNAAVSVAMALQAIQQGMRSLFQEALYQVVEEAVVAAAIAVAIITIITIILIIIAVVIVVVVIVFLLPEILAALGIGGTAAAGGVAVAAPVATGAATVGTGSVVLGTGVTSTGVTLTLLQGGAATTTGLAISAETIAAATSAAAAVMLALGLTSEPASPGTSPDTL